MKPKQRATRQHRPIRWRFERPAAVPYAPGVSPVADMWARFAHATSGNLMTGRAFDATEPQTVHVSWRPRIIAK